MSRRIAVHVVAGILFVGLGTSEAQESMPRPAVVEARDTPTSRGVLPTRDDSSSPKNDMLEPDVLFRLDPVTGIEGDVGVAVAIAPDIHLDDPNDNIDGRQNSDRSPETRATHLSPRRAPLADGSQERCYGWPSSLWVGCSLRARNEARS